MVRFSGGRHRKGLQTMTSVALFCVPALKRIVESVAAMVVGWLMVVAMFEWWEVRYVRHENRTHGSTGR